MNRDRCDSNPAPQSLLAPTMRWNWRTRRGNAPWICFSPEWPTLILERTASRGPAGAPLNVLRTFETHGPSLGRFFPSLGLKLEQILPALDDVLGNDIFAVVLLLGKVVHQIQHDLFAYGTKGPGAGLAL
jgi:hypothetical protein